MPAPAYLAALLCLLSYHSPEVAVAIEPWPGAPGQLPMQNSALPSSLQVSKVHKAGSSTPAGLTLKPAGPEKADYVYYDNIQ